MNLTPLFRASLFRHGKSNYTQGNGDQDLATANDLVPDAIELVHRSAQKLAKTIEPDRPHIHIHTSPNGRTIHTARIIKDVLGGKGYDIVSFEIDHSLGEVRNFSWNLFEPLMNGGRIPWQDDSFVVKKEETNPQGLGYPDYFMADAIHVIDPAVLATWPTEFVSRLQGFETFAQVTSRVTSRIKNVLDGRHQADHHDIFVSHDGSAMALLDSATKGEKKSLDPGTYILLQAVDGQIKAVHL